MNTVLWAALAVAICGAAPVWADTPPPYPEFTFKRVKPPAAGTPRINVQIAPNEPTVGAVSTGPDADASKAPVIQGSYAWYWDIVSPDISASGPGRLLPALTALQGGPDGASVAAPRLQQLQEIARAHGIEILKSTVGTNVSPALVLAVMAVESGGRVEAQSGAGASGLMQLMPATAERFGVTDVYDPAQNIRGGVGYLNWLMGEFKKDPVLVLAAYNAGENAVRDNAGVPPFRETRDYVPKVLAAWSVARGLCITPPELISDGCVFQVMTSG